MTIADTTAGLKTSVIAVRGARVHNLRDVDVDIPRNALVVITGVSGCGKSSLAFDTLCAEGQRRYLESLSVRSRQFLNQLQRPDVDAIQGLPPTISIDQRSGTAQPRSTLATTTEIYSYLRLLYARAGEAHCTQCGRAVAQQSPQRILQSVMQLGERRKLMLLAPIVKARRGVHRDEFLKICKEGFVRARVDGHIVDAAEPPALDARKRHVIEAVIDRLILKPGIEPRLLESIELALKHGNGTCLVSYQDGPAWCDRLYSSRLACPDCDISFAELEPRTFSFNSPYGACPDCQGMGRIIDGQSAGALDAATDPTGPACPACQGARLGPVARGVTFADVPIHAMTGQTVAHADSFVKELLRDMEHRNNEDASWLTRLAPEGRLAAQGLLPEIAKRLSYLCRIGLDYLTLDRPTRSLSGGEFQRARLAGSLGSGLTGVCYILDEPTIGLHPRDTNRLIDTLEELRDYGNSVVVVEHDGDVMRRADHLIDLGPGAGRAGGCVVAFGTPTEVAQCRESSTGRYLSHATTVRTQWRDRIRTPNNVLRLTGADLHNLKQVAVEFPLGVFTVVTGVSGSGKTSLVLDTLVPTLRRHLASRPPSGKRRQDQPSIDGVKTPEHSAELTGDEAIGRLVEVDQRPLGGSTRSNPATYSGIWDEVRKVFAQTQDARLRGFTARRFSFNAKQGRCADCAGRGEKRIEMRFLPDVSVVCPTCRGARFNQQTLSIRYRGKTAADVLQMRIDEAAVFFENFSRLQHTLQTFSDVGLGYLGLGQSARTLSGGETQRVRLATELSRTTTEHTLFVLDEPTTGLHPADVVRLLDLLQRLVEQGHTVVVVEHQLDVIAAADWIIDLGPEGGDGGGTIVTTGTPEEVSRCAKSHTGIALQTRFDASKEE